MVSIANEAPVVEPSPHEELPQAQEVAVAQEKKNQNIVEGAFSVHNLKITLKYVQFGIHNDRDDSLSSEIVVATLDRINIHFVKKTYDLKVEASLHSLLIEDKMQKYGRYFS